MNDRFKNLNFNDVLNIVQGFYNKARQHPVIGHFFDHIEDFSEHENKIAAFWWMALGRASAELPFDIPAIDMPGKHIPLGIKERDLKIWLALFEQTLFEQLNMKIASAWQLKTHEIANQLKSFAIDKKPIGIKIEEPDK